MSNAGGIIDAHHHVWNLGHRDQSWITGDALAPLKRNFSLADLEPDATAAGVEGTIVVETVNDVAETPELLALADRSEFVKAVVGWTDLTAPGIAEALAALRELPGGQYLAGVRHQVQLESDPDWLCRKDVLCGLAAVADAGLAYDLIIHSGQLPASIAAARALPQLTFVLNHLGKPLVASRQVEPWASNIRQLAQLPNVYAKLSGLVTEANWRTWTLADLYPYTETALAAFTPQRLMFGSDWPVCLLASSYQQVHQSTTMLLAGLHPREKAAVFSGTARATYRLT